MHASISHLTVISAFKRPSRMAACKAFIFDPPPDTKTASFAGGRSGASSGRACADVKRAFSCLRANRPTLVLVIEKDEDGLQLYLIGPWLNDGRRGCP
eukprot:scaffold220841_cov19-Tisochrysis_lutea.AAC.1